MKQSQKKKLKISYAVQEKHWVGDGFYVYGLLRPKAEINDYISPFILVDYASEHIFSKTDKPRGIGEHPHRGFETVTLAYQGEIAHRDSSGGGGIIHAGGVQWMTAGSGVVHDEFHSEKFSKQGGAFEMAQLWINLPKKDKMTKPKYQEIKPEEIPVVQLSSKSELRVIAGSFKKTRGPASTFTDIHMYDVKSSAEDEINLNFTSGSNTLVFILSGELELDEQRYSKQNVLVFDQLGEEVSFKTSDKFKGLILNGTPIDEPMVTHGPFVMNSKEEILEAVQDYHAGKMGTL